MFASKKRKKEALHLVRGEKVFLPHGSGEGKKSILRGGKKPGKGARNQLRRR